MVRVYEVIEDDRSNGVNVCVCVFSEVIMMAHVPYYFQVVNVMILMLLMMPKRKKRPLWRKMNTKDTRV